MSMIDTHKGIIPWFARNPVAANLLMWILLIGGFVTALSGVQKQVFPKISVNVISVRVPFLGAAPQEVEKGVILKLEDAVKEIDGIKKMTSTASEGMARVSLEILDEYDPQLVLDEVKVAVDAIPSLPENTEKPIVYRIKPTMQVMWMSLFGDADERELKEVAKEIREEMANLPGVSKVELVAVRDYEIAVEVPKDRLDEYGLTFDQVVQAVRASSLDLPGGSIRSEGGDILLRASGQAYRGHEFSNIVLLTREDGTRLMLGDIAEVNDGFIDDEWMSLSNRKEAVFIRVDSVGDQNDLEIAKTVKGYLEDKLKKIPGNIEVVPWADMSKMLDARLNLMIENMVGGALLVFLILSLFLKLRLAFWVMLGLPICFLGTILLMPELSLTINMISLFAFILVLGIVVDDAIVIGESSYAEMERKGHSLDNIIIGAKRVAMPATFGVLTTVAAFLPMLMVSGVMGIIWKTIALVVILCLLFSLVESKLILPAHLAHMKVEEYDPEKANAFQRARENFNVKFKIFIQEKYGPFLRRSLENRYNTLAFFIAGIILAIGIVASGLMKVQFFPTLSGDFVQTTVEMQPGSSPKQRDDAIMATYNALYDMDADIQAEGMNSVIAHAIAFNSGRISGQIMAELTPNEERILSDVDINNMWRKKVGELAGVKSINFATGGIGPEQGLDFRMSSKNMDSLQSASKELKDYLKTFDGVYDVNDSFTSGSEEIQLHIKPEAETLGLTLQDLARQVRYAFYGAEAQRVQRGDEEVKVMVRYPRHERSSVGDLEKMWIRTPKGQLVPFTEVADYTIGAGYSAITRIDGIRSISISGKLDKNKTELGEIMEQVNSEFLPDLKLRYTNVDFGVQGATQEQAEAGVALVKGFLLTMFLIYSLLAIPLKSYSQPLIIMSVIPFGTVGAILGHIITGNALSILSFMGIIALSGVVVNDSLILVDFVNKARAEGMSLREAVVNAGIQRFRAIILTSATTFLGLVPILLETSMQAQVMIPMAVSLAFGIVFATLITLVLVPSMYIILDDIKGVFSRSKRLKAAEQQAQEA